MIPEGWTAPTLGEVFTLKNGLNEERALCGSGIGFVNAMDVFRANTLRHADIVGSTAICQFASNCDPRFASNNGSDALLVQPVGSTQQESVGLIEEMVTSVGCAGSPRTAASRNLKS